MFIQPFLHMKHNKTSLCTLYVHSLYEPEPLEQTGETNTIDVVLQVETFFVT